jgi:hypothetical protein
MKVLRKRFSKKSNINKNGYLSFSSLFKGNNQDSKIDGAR